MYIYIFMYIYLFTFILICNLLNVWLTLRIDLTLFYFRPNIDRVKVFYYINIYIYIFFLIGCSELSMFTSLSLQGLSLKVHHVFACEIDERKRSILLQQYKMDHLFHDVVVFRDGKGYCDVCKKVHEVSTKTCAIDLLASGLVCVDLSRLNANRQQFAGCYSADPDDMIGTSGPTYAFGFKEAGPTSEQNLEHVYSILSCWLNPPK